MKHVFQTYLPTCIIVAVSWLSFVIPPSSIPGRMGMLVVLLLVIINIMLKIVEMSPMNSGICGLTSWTIMCLIMVVYKTQFLTIQSNRNKMMKIQGIFNDTYSWIKLLLYFLILTDYFSFTGICCSSLMHAIP